MPDSQAVERAAAMLRSGARTAILIAGNGLYGKGLLAAGAYRIGNGRQTIGSLPYYSAATGRGIARGSIACSMCSNRESSSSRNFGS